MIVGMRKAVAVCLVLFGWGTLSASPKGAVGHRGHNGFVLAERPETAGFSLRGNSDAVLPIISATFDRQTLGGEATAGIVPEIEASVLKKDASAPVSLSVFLGRGNGDVFSSLHEQYAWRTKFKSLTLGAGIYRDIPILKTLRIQPYIGIVRTQALLRPSDLYGNNESFEYRLTAFCIGLPLVCGF